MATYKQCITDQKTIYESAGYPYYDGGGEHGGIDTVHDNYKAYAPLAGKVVWAQVWDGSTITGNMSWGNMILVEFEPNKYWLAAHFASQIWSEGDTIAQGQFIGTQGETGNVTGVHTHWEYWDGGQTIAYRKDPSSILRIPNGVGTYNVTWDANTPQPKPPLPDAKWHAKNLYGYSRESSEAQDNAIMIYKALVQSLGWTLNAVSAVLGNMEWESGYNPWRWGWDEPLPSTDYRKDDIGYGLVQFTPPQKYIDADIAKSSPGYAPHFSDVMGSPNDGTAQCYFLSNATNLWYPVSPYNMSYAEFKASTKSPEYLASVFLDTYERPAYPEETRADREKAARYWYNYLVQYDPDTPPTPPEPPEPPTPGRKSMPIWMMCLGYRKRMI